MSAFAPYRKVVKMENPAVKWSNGDKVAKNRLVGSVQIPIEWTTMLLGLPAYPSRLLGWRCVPNGQMEDPVQKREKFFIKNILKSEDNATEKETLERGRKCFEEEASKMETIMSNLGKSDAGHRCIYCGKTYSRKYGLKIHIRTHTGYKPLKCKYCLRPFGDPSNLNKHVRLHARGQTPYNCKFCGKVLVRRRDLERHVKSKHSEMS